MGRILLVRIPRIVGANFGIGITDGRTAIRFETATDGMPLELPSAVLRDRIAIAFHVVFISTTWRQFRRMDDTVADMPPSPACRYRTTDMVGHGNIGGWSNRAIVSHPDIGLDTTTGIGRAAADFVLKLGNDEIGCRSWLENKCEARAIVRLI